jgi:hypothetical protein
MVLICGNSDDRLVKELLRLCTGADWTTKQIDENALFGGTSFAYEGKGASARGFLEISSQKVPLDDVQGAILRLPRAWWPSDEFDLQDQMFVYHETMASWFALFDSLECPVANRCGLGWWLQDLGYPFELRASLADAIDVEASSSGEGQWAGGRLFPTNRPAEEGVASVYRSGGRTIAPPGCHSAVVARLARYEQALSLWEQYNGIALSRLDFELSGVRLQWVEVIPQLEGEPEALVWNVASALLKHVATKNKVAA